MSEVLGTANSQRINSLVTDIVEQNWAVAYPGPDIEALDPCTVELTISPRVEEAANVLKLFLYERVYVGSEAKAEEPKVHHLIRSLFDYFCEHTGELPPETRANPRGEPVERLVVDYISGMTDRFAIATFERIFVPRSWDIK